MGSWQTHPQKFCLKVYCTIIYYLGGGNCWYTEKKISKPARVAYNIYAVIINVFAFSNYLNQLLASCRPLTTKEKNDVIQFDIAHATILAKFVVFYLHKNRIKALLERFLEDDREFSLVGIEKASAKRALKFCFAMQVTLFATVFTAFMDAVRIHVKEGIPVRTEVVYYPTLSHSGFFINVLRVFVELHWWYIVTMMTAIDAISVCFMVFLSAKFKLLATYFESISDKLLANVGKKSEEELNKLYRDSLIVGIKLHQNNLWYAERIQYGLGNLYSVQIIETMFLLIMCLIKLVVLEKSLTFLMASMSYMSCLVAILGGYMMAGGDVTYEASLVPNGIFNSGWEMISSSKKIRTLVVVAMIRSQRPVVMTSFGIFELSYSNFISVIRSSYSFFAVMY